MEDFMQDDRNGIAEMLYSVAKQKKEIIDNTENDAENERATKEFLDCCKTYQALQRDADNVFLEREKMEREEQSKTEDRELEASRIDNEKRAAVKAEDQKDRFDKWRIGLEIAGFTVTTVATILSFKVLNNYQEINMNTVIQNKDAVREAGNLFNKLAFRKS